MQGEKQNSDKPAPIRRTITVPASVALAFRTFTADMAHWWPRAYTWSVEELERIIIEARQGGRWYEIGRDGGEVAWGTVLEWDPPERLALSWQIRPDRTPEPDTSRASQVDVRFFEDAPGETRIELTHDGFERHGSGALEYRAGMDSPQGWTEILDRFRAAVAGG